MIFYVKNNDKFSNDDFDNRLHKIILFDEFNPYHHDFEQWKIVMDGGIISTSDKYVKGYNEVDFSGTIPIITTNLNLHEAFLSFKNITKNERNSFKNRCYFIDTSD